MTRSFVRQFAVLAAGLAAFASPLAARQAPGIIVGRVAAEEGGAPLGAAMIELRLAADTTLLATVMPDAGGRFRFVAVTPGRYVVRATFLGYVAQSRDATVAEGQTVDVGTLALASDVIELDAVTVETQPAPATFAPDRDIYDATELTAAAGGVATELLAAIPELEVDIDGSVGMRGSEPRIYINGRPAPMDGEALNVFLQQFPADAIERVEVIPNPSARYDADGAGIINIVLKEGASLGMSGSVYANAHTRGEAGLGGRVTWQKGDVTLFGNTFLRRNDRESESYDLRQNLITDPTTFLRQDAFDERGGVSGSIDLSADWQFSEKSALRVEGSFRDFGSTSDGRRTTTHLDENEELTSRYDRISRTESTRIQSDATIRFTHEFDRERDHEFEIEVRAGSGNNDSDRRVETRFDVLADEDAIVPADLTLEDRDRRDSDLRVDIDYAHPWGERGSIEVGYRGRIQNRDDHRLLEQFDADQLDLPVETSIRGFDRRERSDALYVTLRRSIGNLGLQIGGRVEHSDNEFQEPGGGDPFEARYVDFFPSANLTWTFDRGKRLRFSYSRRTRRPGPQDLNPIDRSTDPLNRQVGNPDLEPQYTHSFGFDASTSTSWGTLRFSPYYRRITNDWTDIRTLDENGIATTMPLNVASQDMYGASVTASVRRQDGWGGFLSLSGNGQHRDASNLSDRWSGSSFRWSLRGNVSGRLTPTLSLRSTASYRPPQDVPQGRRSSRIDSNLGLRQQLLGGRASLNLSIRDPFELSNSSFESRDPTYVQIGRSEISQRSVSISFSYNFGGGQGRRGGGGGRGGR